MNRNLTGGYKWELWIDGCCIDVGDGVLYETEEEAREAATFGAEQKIKDWSINNPKHHYSIEDIEIRVFEDQE